MKNKYIAGFLAFGGGILGLHKFYLGKWIMGIIYIMLSITIFFIWIPLVLGILEGLNILQISKKDFDMKYNLKYLKKEKELKDLGYKEKTKNKNFGLNSKEKIKQFVVGSIFIFICLFLYYIFR